MNLAILGGSAAGGNTGAGCSGYLVETGLTTLVMDLGPGTLLELRRHTDFRALDAIVISHFHLDHVLDLCALRFALAYNPIKAPRLIPLWLPPGATQRFTRLGAAFADEDQVDDFFPSVFEIHEYDPDRPLNIGDIQVDFKATVHYVPTWAMRLTGPDHHMLAYTADTGPAANLDDFCAGVDLLVAESTLVETRDEPYDQRGHLTASEAGHLAAVSGAKTLVLTHMWEELDFDRYHAEAARTFGGQIVMARPGITVAW